MASFESFFWINISEIPTTEPTRELAKIINGMDFHPRKAPIMANQKSHDNQQLRQQKMKEEYSRARFACPPLPYPNHNQCGDNQEAAGKNPGGQNK